MSRSRPNWLLLIFEYTVAVGLLYVGNVAFAQEGGHEFRYAVIDLGTLGGQRTECYAINDYGNIVGFSQETSPLYKIRGFLWKQGAMEDLGATGPNSSRTRSRSEAFGINNFGIIVGASADPGSTGRNSAVIWDASHVIHLLPGLGGNRSEAWAVNNHDLVVGVSTFAGGEDYNLRAVAWKDGEITDLGTLGGETSEAWAANDSGQITGEASTPDHGHAVIWNPDGTVTDLGALVAGNVTSRAFDINNSGAVVGMALVASEHAFLWENGKAIDINDNRQSGVSTATAINDDGVIVGQMTARRGWTAFIRDPKSGQVTDLQTICPPFMKYHVLYPAAINNAGQITAFDSWGDPQHSMLITPVYPTMQLLQPIPRRLGTVNEITITGCPPNRAVYLMYGLHGGGTLIPACNPQEAALQIDDAKVAGSAMSDGDGNVIIQRYVGMDVRGSNLLLQAVEPTTCQQSQLLVTKFR